jgi:hypothetical protein
MAAEVEVEVTRLMAFLLEQVALVVVAQVMLRQIRRVRQAQLILAVVLVAVEAAVLEQVQLVVQASLSFPTLAHNEAQAAQSHQAVVTLFTHLRPLGLIQHDYARALKRAF